jgi:geranylgeranyl transferase type-1 subunit beta
VSALFLLDRPQEATAKHNGEMLQRAISDMPNLLKFLAFRQFEYLTREESEEDDEDPNFVDPPSLDSLSLHNDLLVGFNGRCNKVADSCYCWWVGGTLSVCIVAFPFRVIYSH